MTRAAASRAPADQRGSQPTLHLGATLTSREVVSLPPQPGITWPGPAEVATTPVATWLVTPGAGRRDELAPVGFWFVARIPVGAPYPCRCSLSGGTCRDVEHHAVIAKRGWRPCDCWGQPVDADTPPGCCRRHPDSVRLAERRPPDPVPAAFTDDPDQPAVPSDDAGELYLWREHADGELVERRQAFVEVDRAQLLADLDEEAAEAGWRVAVDAAKARLADVVCRCVTPWDGTQRHGFHCIECHRNFASAGVASMHSKDWRYPCKDPATVCDCDTGRPLLERWGDGVWHWAANDVGDDD